MTWQTDKVSDKVSFSVSQIGVANYTVLANGEPEVLWLRLGKGGSYS